ncbi:MAG: hypothetical protein J6Y19_06870 [Kiritimatiellae bacterium]|nr:hypothetical protein [Kiritimatiellia bacterium]
MGELVKMRPLTDEEYAKTAWRKKQAALSPPEKVRQVVAMQKRARPILAARGVLIVPWTLDEEEKHP